MARTTASQVVVSAINGSTRVVLKAGMLAAATATSANVRAAPRKMTGSRGLTLDDSAKAAAALGRRCLQTLIREHVTLRGGRKVTPGNLYDEIG